MQNDGMTSLSSCDVFLLRTNADLLLINNNGLMPLVMFDQMVNPAALLVY